MYLFIINILKKIFKNILHFHLIPFKIYKRINNKILFKSYNENNFISAQIEMFKFFNLNRSNALNKLVEIKKQYPFIQQQMSSEHQVLFASLSIQ